MTSAAGDMRPCIKMGHAEIPPKEVICEYI